MVLGSIYIFAGVYMILLYGPTVWIADLSHVPSTSEAVAVKTRHYKEYSTAYSLMRVLLYIDAIFSYASGGVAMWVKFWNYSTVTIELLFVKDVRSIVQLVGRLSRPPEVPAYSPPGEE